MKIDTYVKHMLMFACDCFQNFFKSFYIFLNFRTLLLRYFPKNLKNIKTFQKILKKITGKHEHVFYIRVNFHKEMTLRLPCTKKTNHWLVFRAVICLFCTGQPKCYFFTKINRYVRRNLMFACDFFQIFLKIFYIFLNFWNIPQQ